MTSPNILRPGDPGYDAARRVWNASIDRRPVGLARCAAPDDVRAALAEARARGLPVAVRGGGYSVGGHSAIDGGLVIDLSPMRDIAIATDGEVASIGGGCTWGDAIARLEPLGLATPGAFDIRVGVGVLTLGGGYGLLSRVQGMACDNLVGADVVLASGDVVRAEDDPDLLWALRGAGANFGVVTTLRLGLRPLPPLVAGVVAFRIEDLAAVLDRYRAWAPSLPDNVTAYFGIETSAERPGLAFTTLFHLGEPAEAARHVATLCAFGDPTLVDVTERSYSSVHLANVETFPEGHHHRWRARFLRGLDDGVAAAIAKHALAAPGLDLYLAIEHLGGAMGRVAPDATAFPHRQAPYGVAGTVKWPSGRPRPQAALDILDALHAALAPWSVGTYANYVGADQGEADVQAAYDGNLPRLRELKRRYDPANLFRGNVNIKPGQ